MCVWSDEYCKDSVLDLIDLCLEQRRSQPESASFELALPRSRFQWHVLMQHLYKLSLAVLRSMELWEQEEVVREKKKECISKGVHESSWCVSVRRGWVGWYTVLTLYKQQNCHFNLCRPVDCLDFKRLVIMLCLHFPPFLFFVSAPILFTMAERLNIFEALNLSKGDGGEENDHKNDCTLFFGCTTIPSHALFCCIFIGMTRHSFPILWPCITSYHSLLFILFRTNAARGLR